MLIAKEITNFLRFVIDECDEDYILYIPIYAYYDTFYILGVFDERELAFGSVFKDWKERIAQGREFVKENPNEKPAIWNGGKRRRPRLYILREYRERYNYQIKEFNLNEITRD